MQTILLGYDDSDSAQAALERAADLTAEHEAKLVVASVAPIMLSIGRSIGPVDPTDSPPRHARTLQRARYYLGGRGIDAEYVNTLGRPADAIVELAKSHEADMIVVGSGGPGLAKRLLGESVSDRVVHKAHCPVLVVRRARSRTSQDKPATRIAA